MSAIINIFGMTATFTDGRWECEDKSTQDLLNETIQQLSGADPAPENTAATFVVDNFGGVIIRVDEEKTPDGVIY